MAQFVLPATLEGATTAQKLLKVDFGRSNQLNLKLFYMAVRNFCKTATEKLRHRRKRNYRQKGNLQKQKKSSLKQ